MRYLATILMALSLIMTATPALAATTSGSGSVDGTTDGNLGSYGDCVALEAVTGGTDFELVSSDGGDWDVFFYDAEGNEVDASVSVGDEAGTVPAGSVSGEACLYSAGQVSPLGAGLIDIFVQQGGDSSFCYADGDDLGACSA